MSKRDYYDVLGASKSASPEELKGAYRRLAMQYHPDRNPGDKAAESKFKELNEAYDVLRDDQKRAAYDRFGHQAFANGAQGGADPFAGFGGFGGFNFGRGGGAFADIFDTIFSEYASGRTSDGDHANRGNDTRYNLEITLEEAFKGKNAEIRVPGSLVCDACKGSGAKAGTQPVTCTTCHGQGKVRAQQGFFTIERTCPVCSGAGRVIKDPCPSCNGTGRKRREKTLRVDIPPGVDDGARIRLAGEGDVGMRGGPPGDLYIFLTVKAHPLFQRDGAELYCRVPLPFTTAALGGEIEVPSIDGTRVPVTIPAGTQTGKQFRERGKGMNGLKSTQRGDLYIEVMVETPRNLSERQKQLLRDFAAESGESASINPESQGFFSRVKDFFDGLAT